MLDFYKFCPFGSFVILSAVKTVMILRLHHSGIITGRWSAGLRWKNYENSNDIKEYTFHLATLKILNFCSDEEECNK